jgi:hypothetical protein
LFYTYAYKNAKQKLMNNPTRYPKKTLFAASFIVLVILGVGALEVTGTTHFFHKKLNPETTKTTTTGGASAFNDKGETALPTTPSDSSNTSAGAKTDGNNGAATVLLAPTGTFVSAHKNVGMDVPLTSVCNTTPGAICQITMTSGISSHSLEGRTADSNGAVYWDRWTPRGIGLTPGVWDVKAKASLNGQSKTTDDALTLEIGS